MSTPTADSPQTQPYDAVGAALLGSFHIATLAIQREKQLKQGSPPRTEMNGHKICRLALMEVRMGAIGWNLTDRVVAEDIPPTIVPLFRR